MSLHAKSRENTPEIASEISGYFRHFGLRQDPFGPEGKENNFYLLPDWEQHIDLILHYLRHENVLLALTGSKGTGKTTLINSFLLEAIHGFSPTETAAKSKLCAGELLVQLGDTTRTCQVIADDALDPEQTLEVITSAFDLPTELLTGTIDEQADALIENLQHTKQRCVLLIDKAHELPDTTLTLLLQLINQQSDVQHQFHVILIGESSLKKRFVKFSKSKDFQTLIHTIELSPLNLAQTEYYLKHRLTASGLQDDMPFATGNVQKIYKLSGGVPKTINQLARQVLIENLNKNSMSSVAAVFKPYKKTLVGGSFLLMSFAIILFYLGQDIKNGNSYSSESSQSHSIVIENNKPSQPTTVQNPALTVQASPAVQASPPPQPTTPPVTQMTEIQPVPAQSSVQPQANVPADAQPTQIPTQLPEQAPAATTSPDNQQSLSPVQSNSSPSTEAPLIASPKKTTTQSTVIESSSLIEPNSAQAAQDASATPPPAFLMQNKQSVAETVAAEKPVESKSLSEDKKITPEHTISSKEKTKKTIAKTNVTAVDNKRFMHMNPNHYTLKLTELPSETAAKAFITKYKLGKNLMYVRNENHYIVIYGEYADPGTAKHAAALLPKKLTSFDLIPYRIGLLQ